MGRMESNPSDNTQPTTPQGSLPSGDATQPMQVDANSLGVAQTQPVQASSDQPGAAQVPPPTQSEQSGDVPPPAPGEPAVNGKRRFWRWAGWSLLGIFFLSLIAVGSGYGGYRSAIQQRVSYERTQVWIEAQAQYNLGLEDLQAGRYDLARQRFEYVINLDPGFPGIAERLAEALLALNSTATPTTAPTPTLTPTLDLRGREELFTQAQAQLLAKDWSSAIETLLTLRKRDPTYQAVQVDGMLFVALRNRGVDKIARQADLEGGTYDLALAERFGPLDVEARNWRQWAEMYIRGASFWGVDWAQAVAYFSQIAPIAPNLVDRSGYTATERYRLALIGYADWLARQGLWCEARDQFQASFNIKGDQAAQPTADFVREQCENPPAEGPTSPDTSLATVTPTPLGTLPAVTPTPTLSAPQDTPTETPPTPYP